jgi:hypothetical protein
MVLEANEGAAAFYAAAGYKDTALSVDKDNGRYRVYGLPLQQQQQQQAEGEEAVPLVSGAGASPTQAAASSGMSKPSASSSRGFGGGGSAKKGRKKARAAACMAYACSRASPSTQTRSSSSSRSGCLGWRLEDPWSLPSTCSSRWGGHMGLSHTALVHGPGLVSSLLPTSAGRRLDRPQQVHRSRPVMQISQGAGRQQLSYTGSSQVAQRQALSRWV